MKEISTPRLKAIKQEAFIGNRKRTLVVIGSPDSLEKMHSSTELPKISKNPVKRISRRCGGCSRKKRRTKKGG